MNKIEELIQELCPQGVYKVRLGTATSESTERNLGAKVNRVRSVTNTSGLVDTNTFWENARTSADTSNYKVVRPGMFVYNPSRINVGSIARNTEIHEVIVSPMYVVFEVDETVLSPAYLMNFFSSPLGKNLIESSTEQGARFRLPFENLAKFMIQIPPLAIQEEIVSILDTFTELELDLESELEKRVSQASHLQRKLFENFSATQAQEPRNPTNWRLSSRAETRQIGDFAKCIAGATPSSGNASYWDAGTIPWMSSGEVNNRIIFETEKMITTLGYDSCSTKMLPARSVVIALAGQGKTRGMVARTRIELCTNQSLCGILTDESVNSDYLYHYLKSQYRELREMSSGDGARGGLNLEIIRSVSVPIPSLEVQEQVVGILDKLEQFIADVSHGLPAEIQARRKQYEYYRNKLLTFKELDAA